MTAREIAAAVIFHMPGWQLLPVPEEEKNSYARDGRCDIQRAGDNRVLHFQLYRHDKKLTVSGQFRQDYTPYRLYSSNDENKPITSIGINPERPVEKIAADINARLLPGCETAWALSDERYYRDETAKKEARALAQELAKTLGVNDPTKDERYNHSYRSTRERWRLYTKYDDKRAFCPDVEFESGHESVEWKIRTSIDGARQLAKAIALLNATKGKAKLAKAKARRAR